MSTATRPSLGLRVGGWLLQHAGGAFERLAALEARVAAEAIAPVRVEAPVFIAGLARSGSTILLEALASCASFASLRYCDYPLVWLPYWWTLLRAKLPLPPVAAQERAHGDRIAVTPESPEAFDEVLWMHFFAQRHDPAVDQRLGADVHHPRFEQAYALHIRKLLAARGRPRYLCKGNYNLLRLSYLLKLFPDARFVVPVRAPEAHVASLVKQHRLFSRLSATAPSVGRHLAHSGHFEFGPQRRAEHVGDDAQAATIQADFAAGREVSAYARQWAASYGALARSLRDQPELAKATLLVPYESMCANAAGMLARLAQHCALDANETTHLLRAWAPQMQAPEYYRAEFTPDERALIAAVCAETVALLDAQILPG